MQKYLFTTYEQALALKKLGFNEDCDFYWSLGADDFKQILNSKMYMAGNSTSAPLIQQALKFLRDNGFLYYINPSSVYGKYHTGYLTDNGWVMMRYDDGKLISYTYEEAEIACINKLIESFKEKLIKDII